MKDNKHKKIKFSLTGKDYKMLHRIIASIRDEIAIKFGQRGIELGTPSLCNTQYLTVKMPKTAFESYRVDKNDTIGFDMCGIEVRGVPERNNLNSVSFDIPTYVGNTTDKKHSCILHHGMFNDRLVLPSVGSIYSGYNKPRDQGTECNFKITVKELRKICEHCEQMLVTSDGKTIVFGNVPDEDEWNTDAIEVEKTGEGSAIYSSENILPFVKVLPVKLVLDVGFTDNYPMRIRAEFIEGCMAEWLVAPRIASD